MDPKHVSGGSAGSSIPVPLDVYQRLAYQSNSAEELQQKIAQWQAQQQALQNISGLAQQYPDRVQVDATHWVDPYTGSVFELKRGADKADGSQGDVTFSQYSDGDSKRYLTAKGINLATLGGSSGVGGSSSSTRLASDDPRYWDFQYAQLDQQSKEHVDQMAYQYAQLGQTGENARRSALMQFIQSRDSLASNTAQTSANVAKQIADYAANPRDTYAEAVYRNQVGGSTPFGDLQNQAFGDYGKALQQKGVNIFQNVAGDLNASRQYRDALPLNDWLPADLRGAGQPTGSPTAPIPAGAVGANPLASFAGASPEQLAAINHIADQANPLRSFVGASPEQLAAINKIAQQRAASPVPQGATTPPIDFTKTGGVAGPMASTSPIDLNQPKAYAKGGTLNFDSMFDRSQPGYSPSSSEGGTNLSIHERAVIVGESGHVYGTLGEKRPDGTVRSEQLQIKPLKSEVQKDKRLEEGHKAIVETQKKTMSSFAGGGSVTADPSLDEMNAQYSQLLQRLGGMGGGSSTPYGGARFLAGAPANAIGEDPYLKGITEAGYSMRGVDPSELWAQVAKFTPPGVRNNEPRVSFA